MPLPSELVFCETCQCEQTDCKHLCREAYLKELRDAAWNRVMGPSPAEKYAREMWTAQGHSAKEIEFLLRHSRKWGDLEGLREREEAQARQLRISILESRRQDRIAIRELRSGLRRRQIDFDAIYATEELD
jgi:hypothetical protein